MSQFSTARARSTDLCERAGITAPVLNAPVPGAAGPELVAAVSEAGGLGVIPAADMTPGEIENFAREVRARTSAPFAAALRISRVPTLLSGDALEAARRYVDALSPLLESLELPAAFDYWAEAARRTPDFREQFDAALACGPAALLSTFGGFREPEADRLADAGVLNFGGATTLLEAKVQRAAGADAVVLQGAEAAGPRWAFEDREDALSGLFGMLSDAVRATGLPVIATGAVHDSLQCEGLKAAGAAGVMAGTAFLTTREARVSEALAFAARSAKAAETRTTRVFSGALERVFENGLLEALADWAGDVPHWAGVAKIFEAIDERARAAGDASLEVLRVGQGAGRSGFAEVRDVVSSLGAAWMHRSGIKR